MSASTLRAAAALIRERASAATPGPWRDSSTEAGARFAALVADAPHPDRPTPDKGGWAWDDAYGGCLIGESLMAGDRAHIASWHPDVALAVAHLIDTILKVGPVDGGAEWDATVNLARTYLGESA